MDDMQGKGITPFAFGDKDGWPAMGTFDILNMRLNGFDFHMSLMAGEEAWDSDEVKKVFETWTTCFPTTRRTRWAAPGRRPRPRWPRATAGCTCSAPSSPTPSPTSGRPRLLHLPGDRRHHRHRRARRAHRRLLPRRRRPNQDAGKAMPSSSAPPRPPTPPTPTRTPPSSPPTPTPARDATRPAEEVGRGRGRRLPTSRSSWTATPTPTSPPR